MRLIAYLDELDLPVAGVLVGDRVHTLDRLAEEAGLREELALLDLRGLLAEDAGLDETRAAAARAEAAGLPGVPADDLRLVAPLEPGKIVCIGNNHRLHILEQSLPMPDHPLLFAIFGNAVVGHLEAVIRPATTRALDLEAELGVIIGRRACRIPREEALDHVFGYVAANDISARDLQGSKPALREGARGDGQWLRAKGSDTFLPLGPCVVTADEFPDPDDIRLRSFVTRADGPDAGREMPMQDGRTSDFVFSIPELISFISHSITLDPGDLVITGTPSGVGVFRDPPVYLQPGDLVRVEVEGIGSLSNPVVEHDSSVPAGSPAALALNARAAKLAALGSA